MKKLTLIIVALALTLSTLTACGSDEVPTDSLTLPEDDKYAFLNGMEDGILYVLHPDNTYTPTVFNAATFNRGEMSGTANKDRIIWFKEDFNDIPTFYEGQDKLVMYTKNQVPEEIFLERFKDLGVSVGLCQLKPRESGKYSISTDPDDNNTYPGSDADEILNYTNETVMVDTIQGISLRTDETLKINEEKDIAYDQAKDVTEYGTISNLAEYNYYDVDIYDGSKKNVLKLYADTHIMGSCKVIKKLNYHFTYDYLQEFELPPNLYTGYYTINSLGVFRFIAKNDAYTTTTNYNVGADEDEDEKQKPEPEEGDSLGDDLSDYVIPEQESRTIIGEKSNIDDAVEKADEMIMTDEEPDKEDVVENAYDIETEDAYVRFMISFDGTPEQSERASAAITTPNGVAMDMTRIDASGALYADLYVETSGQYTITMKNTTGLNPQVNVSIIEEEQANSEGQASSEE